MNDFQSKYLTEVSRRLQQAGFSVMQEEDGRLLVEQDSQYDRVYMSKVFTFTPDFDTAITADEIITGGTGYKDYGSLPPEVEACPPDYTLYPKWKPAIGFLKVSTTRARDPGSRDTIKKEARI